MLRSSMRSSEAAPSDPNPNPASSPRPAPRLAVWLPAVFFLAVLALGLLLTALDPATAKRNGRSGLLDGTWAARYQRAYEDGIGIRGFAISTWALIRYRLFGEGSAEVLVGSDGWLFSAEEFRPPDDLSLPLSSALDRIRETRDALSGRGIELAVALVPTKALVYEDRLGRYSVPRDVAGLYAAALSRIQALGILAPDLLTPLRKASRDRDLYLRTDTHWSPAGARLAAQLLARSIRPILDERHSSRTEFTTRSSGTREVAGDLLKFVALGPWARLGPRPDSVEIVITEAAGDVGDDLFEELDIPVTLVGTSYSAGGLWNFEGALKDLLEADVLNVAAEGKGPFAPMAAYLASPAIEDPRPDIVLWEIPVRYLSPESR